MKLVERVDDYQRRHPRVALPVAVWKKYSDDKGGYLAALITYYGFLSLFPLLLLLSTILNFVLHGDPHLQHRILNSALGQFPIVGDQLSTGKGVSGSGIGLAVGIVGTLFGGLGVAQAAQYAMNTIWQVPQRERPNAIKSRLRSLTLLVVVGVSVLGTTVLSALGTSAGAYGASVGDGVKVLLVAAAFVVNVAIFTSAFHVATARELKIRESLPGAIMAAICWQLLQWFGTAYIGHVVKHASVTNSVFALVLGLIAWIYLESTVVIYSVEYNAVKVLGLHPRSLTDPEPPRTPTAADEEVAAGQRATASPDLSRSD